MSELLPVLAFSLVVGGQFLAVVAVHGLTQDKRTSSADTGKWADGLTVASIEPI